MPEHNNQLLDSTNDDSVHPTSTRRAFLGGLGAVALAAGLPRPLLAGQDTFKRTHDEVARLLKPLLETSDPALFDFAVSVYEHAIFGRMQPAEPPIKHPWLIPGGPYVGQWVWDTTFLTDLVAILPGQDEFIRGIYQNYWDAQGRLDTVKPAYRRGMVPNFIAPDSGPPGFTGKDWETFPGFSQAPLICWGVERVYRRTHDLELVRAALPHLEEFHDWYWRERDVTGAGLVTVGSYDGVAQHARFETYDNEVDLDTLQMTPHPGRPAGAENGPWYGDICIPANTGYLLLSEQRMIELAEAVGDHALAARRKPILKKGIAAMRRHMWDEEAGCFLAVRRGTMEKIRPATVGGMVPVQGPAVTNKQAARMAQALMTKDWATPLPIPSVVRSAEAYRSDGFWRGDVWPTTVFQTVMGLARHGQRALAGEIAGKLIDNAMKVGVSERYDSQTGAPLGVRNLGMSSIILTIALEGVSPRHKIRVRD